MDSVHLHISFADAAVIAAVLLLTSAVWRTLTAYLADRESPWAAAFAFVL